METSARLYAYNFSQARTYLLALVFVAGNIILPQLCHSIPQGGMIFLPIYFFTLIGAYKYGIKVGLLTAVLSPVVNHLLFGMPAAGVLIPILIKSSLLAVAAAMAARRFGKVSLLAVALAVIAYQLIGTAAEWAVTGSLVTALQDLRLGIPGMLIQIFGGYALLKALAKV